jgi:hypothetical protein
MSVHIKQILDICLNTNTWRAALLRNWPQIIGRLSNRVHIEKIGDDTLTLSVSDSCLMHELHLLSSVLCTTINQTLDQPYIKQIRFKKAALPQTKKQSTYEGAACKIKPIRLTAAEQHALSLMTDIELRDVLKAFCVRCHRERS